jgi:hypothetical protein
MTPDEYKKKCQQISDFYRKAAETGRKMQEREMRRGKEIWVARGAGPTLYEGMERWRLKPEPLEPEPQKLWIVWNQRLGFSPWIWGDKAAAERCAEYNGGILQEITRPESQ